MTDYLTYCDLARIADRIDCLATMTEPERPYSRLVFSPEFDTARAWLKQQFLAAGLICHVDNGGSLIGVRRGKKSDKKVVLGSHIDTVPAGGRFDGIAGVLAALEVVHHLNDAEIDLPFDLEIVDYLGEELNVWGTSCLGSRHMAGLVTAEMLERVDADGRRLGDEIVRVGGSGQALGERRSDADNIIACLELHIEQATILESSGCDIGVVTGIPGIYRYVIDVRGQAGHSGTTQMAGRQDALVAAADIIVATNALATAIASDDNQHFVATIGKIDVFPNGAAIVPGVAQMTLDLRAASEQGRRRFLDHFETHLASVRAGRHCAIEFRSLAAAPPAPMDSGLQKLLTARAAALGLKSMPISSGAGHDTAHLSRIAPAAMIFIPCRDGLSHCPEEFAATDSIAKGAAVLAQAVLELALNHVVD